MTTKEIRKRFNNLCKEQKECILEFRRVIAYYNELDKEQDLYGHYDSEEYKYALEKIDLIIEDSKKWFCFSKKENAILYLKEMSDLL